MSDQVVGVVPRSASPVRRGYVVVAVLALAMMVLAIQYGSDWLLNFLHVMTGALWTGIDLFMGFVVGPILRRVEMPVRREIIIRQRVRSMASRLKYASYGRHAITKAPCEKWVRAQFRVDVRC